MWNVSTGYRVYCLAKYCCYTMVEALCANFNIGRTARGCQAGNEANNTPFF